MARIATHCTEADISEQHIQMAKKLDMEAIGFLMMAHMNSPEGLVEQALLMQSYGADAIYIADSAGAMTTEDVQRRVSALVKALDIPLGVHAHNNLAMAVSNSIAAYQEGAANLDGTSAGLGAGAGNCPTEILAAVSNKYGIETGVDALKLMDVAEEVVRPIMPRQQVIDRAGLILGYAGVYGSFLLHSQKAAERYDVPQAEILMELGRRQVVGGTRRHDHRRCVGTSPKACGGERMNKTELAERLIRAASDRVATTPLTDDFPDLDVDTAYTIQDTVVEARRASGAVIVGAKLGLTSKAKQEQMNVDEPLYGWLSHDMHIDTGEPLVCDRFIQPRCEPEIAFLLGEDLSGPDVSAARVIAATQLVFPAIDVLDSRFAGYSFTLPMSWPITPRAPVSFSVGRGRARPTSICA